jgi:hypothetical protein
MSSRKKGRRGVQEGPLVQMLDRQRVQQRMRPRNWWMQQRLRLGNWRMPPRKRRQQRKRPRRQQHCQRPKKHSATADLRAAHVSDGSRCTREQSVCIRLLLCKHWVLLGLPSRDSA